MTITDEVKTMTVPQLYGLRYKISCQLVAGEISWAEWAEADLVLISLIHQKTTEVIP